MYLTKAVEFAALKWLEFLLKINFANTNPRTFLVLPKFANPGAETLRSCALRGKVLEI